MFGSSGQLRLARDAGFAQVDPLAAHGDALCAETFALRLSARDRLVGTDDAVPRNGAMSKQLIDVCLESSMRMIFLADDPDPEVGPDPHK
jgi:hypothetical protein